MRVTRIKDFLQYLPGMDNHFAGIAELHVEMLKQEDRGGEFFRNFEYVAVDDSGVPLEAIFESS
jgi:hypothetical protein